MRLFQKWLVGILLACFWCGGAAAQDSTEADSQRGVEKSDLRVMSFNIRFGTAADGENHWSQRQESVAQTIQQFQPDVLGTQEVLAFQADYLQKQLPDYVYRGRSREIREDQGEQCGIFYRRDRFAELKSGQFWLSEQPDEPGSKSWDSSLPRIATWVLLRDQQAAGRTFLVLNTHFDHMGKVARVESAKLISRWLKENYSETALVVTGDFNCGEGSEPYQALVSKGSEFPLIDSFRSHHPEATREEGTFNGFRGARDGARIDWILYSSHWKVSEASIIAEEVQGRYPSDHFPVTALLNGSDPEDFGKSDR